GGDCEEATVAVAAGSHAATGSQVGVHAEIHAAQHVDVAKEGEQVDVACCGPGQSTTVDVAGDGDVVARKDIQVTAGVSLAAAAVGDASQINRPVSRVQRDEAADGLIQSGSVDVVYVDVASGVDQNVAGGSERPGAGGLDAVKADVAQRLDAYVA